MATNMKCPDCGYEASSEADLQKHRQQKHGGEGAGQRQSRQPGTSPMGDEE